MKETTNILHPFIKYPGGKSKEAPLVFRYMPKQVSRYVEPFVGGGSIYFALGIHPSLINDKSKDLYLLYSLIKNQDNGFRKYLVEMDQLWLDIENDDFLSAIKNYSFIPQDRFLKYYQSSLKRKDAAIKKFETNGIFVSDKDKVETEITARKTAVYMIIRDIYNSHTNNDKLHLASFYFLREYCYSSMFRFSAKGDFNVPYGGMSYNGKRMTNKINYMFSDVVKSFMKDTVIGNDDFAVFMDKMKLTDSDFVFLDPPYDSDFSTYDNNPFDKKEQIRLRDYLAKTPAKWMLIIKKTDFIFDLYKGFNVFEYDMNYMVSFKNRNDRDVKHLLITNYKLEV